MKKLVTICSVLFFISVLISCSGSDSSESNMNTSVNTTLLDKWWLDTSSAVSFKLDKDGTYERKMSQIESVGTWKCEGDSCEKIKLSIGSEIDQWFKVVSVTEDQLITVFSIDGENFSPLKNTYQNDK